MGPIFYVMAILGCGDGQAACQQVRVMDTHYASVDACSAAMQDALMNASDISFPEVSAECRPGRGALAAGGEKQPRG